MGITIRYDIIEKMFIIKNVRLTTACRLDLIKIKFIVIDYVNS